MRHPAIGAQCESGGFDEFPVAMNWLVLQLGGRSTYTQNGWSNFAMNHGEEAPPRVADKVGAAAPVLALVLVLAVS